MSPLVLTFDWSPMTSFPRPLAPIRLSSFPRNSRGARSLHGRREAPWAGEGWRKRVLRISLPTTRPCAPSVAVSSRPRRSRSVLAHGADGADGAHGEASPLRVQDSAQRLPIGLRRLVVTGGLVLVAALIVSLGIVISGFADAPSRTTTATVQAGQSLWEVAAATGTGDVDRTMSRIVELNGLESSALQAGQVLVVLQN